MLSSHTVEKRDNNNAIINVLKLVHTQKNSNVFVYMLQLTYNIYTYTAKAWLSFCAHTNRCDAVNQSIFRIFRLIYMQRNHTQSSNSALFTCWAHIQHIHIYCEDTTQLLRTYTLMQRSKSINLLIFWSTYIHHKYIHCEDTIQSLLIYTEWQQRLCVHAATHIHHIYIHWKNMIQLLCTYTLMQRSKSIDLLIFWLTYMHRKYIHCENMTQSLLIYTEQQQRLCARVATHIHHTHIYCEGTTQLLRIYTLMQRSKSINLLIFWSTYMRCKYIHCKDTT